MAVTGGRIAASIYGTPAGDFKFGSAITGRLYNFPNVGVQLYDLPPSGPNSVTSNGILMNAVVEVLPTGLNQPSKKYYTPSTVTALLAAGT